MIRLVDDLVINKVVRNYANTIAVTAMVFVFYVFGMSPGKSPGACLFPQSDSPESQSPSETDSNRSWIQSIESGLNGHWRVGYTTQHRISIKVDRNVSLSAEIQTFDGDGVSVTYSDADWKIDLQEGQTGELVVYAKHGRPNRPIVIRFIEQGTGTIVESRPLTESERGTPIPSEQPWMVGVGSDGMGLDAISSRSLKAGLADYNTTQLSQARELPIASKAWDGVDLLVLSSHNTKLLDEISMEQSRGIREWIQKEGGRCVLSLGVHADSWFANPHFAALIPGSLKGVDARSTPGPLESYLNSESRLNELGSALLQLPEVIADLDGQASNRSRYPLIAKWTSGLGKVKFFAGELESQAIQDWAGKTLLLKLLINDQWVAKPTNGASVVEDLSVQLHGALDKYPNLIIGNLTQMTVIVFALLLVVGPLDYFLVAKRWRSPRATWVTIVATAFGCCGLLVWLQKNWKPDSSTINQVEVVEWDSVEKSVHGRVFAHMYGGNRGLYDVTWNPTERSLLRTQKNSSQADVARNESTGPQDDWFGQIDWFGMPGRSIGGFQSTIGTDRMLSGYKIERNSPSEVTLRDLAIPEAGTKALMCSWSGKLTDTPESELKTISGAMDLLTGTVVNPLPCDLISGMLVYRGRFYSLPTRFVAGSSIDINVSSIPKDIARRLQRRVSVDGKDQGTPWKSGDLNDVKRIFEIILFHKAAGAGAYTIGQENRYLSWLDQSDLLKTDRAILFGELEHPQVDWTVERDGVSSNPERGNTVSFVRVVLPVVKGSSSLGSAPSPPSNAATSQ